MRRVWGYTFFPILLLVGSGVSAEAAEAWTGYVEITALYPQPGALQFYVDTNINPTGTCEPNRIQLSSAATDFEVMASAIISAFATNAKVNVNYDDTTLGQCVVKMNRAIIKR